MFRKLNLISATFALMTMIFMFAFANAQPQSKPKPSPTPTPGPPNQSIVDTTKSNVKEHALVLFGDARVRKFQIVRIGELVVISLGLPKPEAFTYNPATGEIKPLSGTPAENNNPIPGIVVVAENKRQALGGGTTITILLSDGKGELPSNVENGNYDLVITIPQSSLPGKPPASKRKGVAITFAMMKTPDGWQKGASSPKVADSR
jgi:hypothetical protein